MADFTKLNGYDVKDAYARNIISSIAPEVAKKKIRSFDTIAQMRECEDLATGEHVITKGAESSTDGYGAEYLIRVKTQGDSIDGRMLIELNDENLVAELITPTDYLPLTVQKVRYQGTADSATDVWYSIIPSDYKPELVLANDTIDTVEEPGKNAMESMATISTNAGLCDVETSVTNGIVIADGVLRKENNAGSAGRYIIYALADGTLNCIESTATTAQVQELNPVWACRAFWPIVKDGIDMTGSRDPSDYQPRTFIGQDSNGNYIIGCCSGRNYRQGGLSAVDMLNFVTSVGFTPYFLFNLDGGGSSTLLYKGKRMNTLVDYENRSVANFIVFRSKTAHNKSVFESAYVTNSKNIQQESDTEAININSHVVVPEGITLVPSSNINMINELVVLNIEFTIDEALAKYGHILENLPLPRSGKYVNVEAINNDRSAGAKNVLCYIAPSTGNLSVSGQENGGLPAGRWHINLSYIVARSA